MGPLQNEGMCGVSMQQAPSNCFVEFYNNTTDFWKMKEKDKNI